MSKCQHCGQRLLRRSKEQIRTKQRLAKKAERYANLISKIQHRAELEAKLPWWKKSSTI